MGDGNSTPNEPWKAGYQKWLVPVGQLTTAEGSTVDVWEFRHQNDPTVLAAWARHFRGHYCSDTQIDALRREPENREPSTYWTSSSPMLPLRLDPVFARVISRKF
jgi:hypothetical protein